MYLLKTEQTLVRLGLMSEATVRQRHELVAPWFRGSLASWL